MICDMIYDMICDMIYLTAIGQPPGGSSSVHMYTQTIHRTTQNYIEQHKKYIERHKTIHRTTQQLGRVRAVPHLCGFYPGICLTTEEKARKNLSPSFCVSYAVTFCVLVTFTVLIAMLIIKEISVL
jgi:hypothetical protein